MPMSIYKKIPNFLTLINLLLGCLALVYLFYDHISIKAVAQSGFEEGGYFDGRAVDIQLAYGKMQIAALLVIFAALFDFVDGFAARFLNATSEMGKQLDSLADMVTFGLVPGVMLYYLLGISFFGSSSAYQFGIWLFVPGLFFTLFAGWRLAKFNITTEDQKSAFRGLPVPAAAIFVAGLVLVLFFNEANLGKVILNSWFLYLVLFLLGFLMVSDIRIINLKFDPADEKGNRKRILLIVICVGVAIAGFFLFQLQFALIPLTIIVYILFSLLDNIISK
jgi:CDP-diacylglycerol---serine O-phosphatidyltransferase